MIISLLFIIAIAIIQYFALTLIVFIIWIIEMIVIKSHKPERYFKGAKCGRPQRTSPYTAQFLRWLVWPVGFYRHSNLSRWWKNALTLMAPLSLTAIILLFESVAWIAGYSFPVITGSVYYSVHSIAPETPSFKLVNYGFDDSAFPDWSEGFYFEFKEPLNEEFKKSLDDSSNGWEKKTSLTDGVYYEKSKSVGNDEIVYHVEYVKIYPESNKGEYIYMDF